MSSSLRTSIPTHRAAAPFVWLLDILGGTWLGMSLLALVFVYASIGSAIPPVREGALADWLGLEWLRFEKSQMEWFSWWPFAALAGLCCLSICAATLRRVPFDLTNAGTWIAHAGVMVMAAGCVYYFGAKVDGDTIIFQSLARIRVPGVPEADLAVSLGAQTTVTSGSKQYGFQVVHIDPDYVATGGTHQGGRSRRIWIRVTCSDPPREFIRTLIDGDPEDTEDLIIGPGGTKPAVDVAGKRIIDSELNIALERDPVSYFYHGHETPVRSEGAIYARPVGSADWTELRLDWLPQYYEHLAHADELWPVVGEAMPALRPLDQPARPAEGSEAAWLAGLNIRATDYLPYARIVSRYVPAGPESPANPAIRLELHGRRRLDPVVLLANDPQGDRLKLMQGFDLRFVWATTAEQRAALIQQPDLTSPGLLFVGGPDSEQVDLVLISPHGRSLHKQVGVGQSTDILPMLPISVEAMWASVRPETRPTIVPAGEREAMLGKGQSLVRVEVSDGQQTQSMWLQFNEYPLPDVQWTQSGDMRYSPEVLTLADGRKIELLYSRPRERLASRVALDRFILKTYPGGDRESDFISLLRFEQADGWSDVKEVRTNLRARHGPYWYSQAKWDPSAQSYTLLGVSNRNGVHAMLIGASVSIVGMIYAFYVKPALRRREQSAESAELAAAGKS